MDQSDKKSQGAEGKEAGDDCLDQESRPAAQQKDVNKRSAKRKGLVRMEGEGEPHEGRRLPLTGSSAQAADAATWLFLTLSSLPVGAANTIENQAESCLGLLPHY